MALQPRRSRCRKMLEKGEIAVVQGRWKWPGSRWWRCDLHVHSPASFDFKDRETVTASEWLEAAQMNGVEVVAVTDHSSGAFVQQLRAAQPQDRGLFLFPGLELNVTPGIHLIALFDPQKPDDCATNLLAACGIQDEEMGKDSAMCSRSIVDVLATAADRVALCVAAHIDKPKGVGVVLERGNGLRAVLQHRELAGVEVEDLRSPALQYAVGARRPLAIITSSDAHSLTEIGRRTTWIKMTTPTLEGLRLALADGPESVKPAAEVDGNPNDHASSLIEEIQITDARYIGRPEPFALALNPWLTAIIGGRGTGKSSVLNFLRLACRREGDLPTSLTDDLAPFQRVYRARKDDGLLTDGTLVSVVYRKDDARFRIQWNLDGSAQAISEETPDGWVRASGEISRRLPVRIFSQKEVFELARDPGALLRLVDETPYVNRADWDRRWRETEAAFLSLRARTRELETSLQDEPRLTADLEDVLRKQAAFERSGHAATLRAYQLRSRQQRAIETWKEALGRPAETLRSVADELAPPDLPPGLLDEESETDRSLLAVTGDIMAKLKAAASELKGLADKIDRIQADASTALAATAWAAELQAAEKAYRHLVEDLRGQGINDPALFGQLVQARHTLERQLAGLASKRQTLASVKHQASATRETLHSLRRELSEKRERFLTETVASNPHVRIDLVRFGNREQLEEAFRVLIGSDAFEKDIYHKNEKTGLVWELFGEPAEEEKPVDEAQVEAFRERVRAIATGRPDGQVRDQRFAAHLSRLRPEVVDRFELLYPEDALRVSYSPRGDGKRFEPIAHGSPGQKTAAILAFVLSHGEEPLVLDQPEDDLDNHLIYNLIVRQLRTAKTRRQILVVTHNPNIVVNGDAELVYSFEVQNGQTAIAAMGGLQEQPVRDEICRVMEGGREAFEARYRRIAGGEPGA